MDTPDFFVGARLGEARVRAGIPLEKAAKDTRIRVQRLREIEADDFSGFTHPTYSRLFLLDYAEYLGISADEIRPLLPDRAGSAGGGFQYINALSRDPLSPVASMRQKRPSLLRIFSVAAALLLLAAGGLFVYSTIKKIERVAGSSPLSGKSTAKQPAAAPSATAEVRPEPPAAPAAVESALPAVSEPSPAADGRENPAPPPAP
ncbi:MAG: helix-turn-helix transcriptional regulator [Terrimicrobiaceae bacterium]